MALLEILAGPLMKIIDKVIPDPAAKQAAQIEILRLQQSGELKAMEADLAMAQGQMEINKTEAGSSNLFVSGWRPFMGWACGGIFVCNYIGVPLLAWCSPLIDIPAPPRLEIGEVLPVLMGMLGLGSLRSVEKIKGTA